MNDIKYDIKDILERIALPARSKSKKGFYNTEKLDEIAKLLEEAGSPFKLIKKTDYAYIFGQQDVVYDKMALLISSHADIVRDIKTPYSKLIEDKKYFKGTYDNLGTNGAAVYAMINYDLPKNAYFAFTADEETGNCRGAEYALAYMQNKTGHDPFVIALDVTDEGYRHNRLFTIEGLHGKTEGYRRGLAKAILETEGNEQSHEYVRLSKEDNNSFLPPDYRSSNLTMYDESVFYASENLNSFSMCLPGTGEMHDDSGFYVKEPVMRGYADSLVSIICRLTLTKQATRQETIDAIKEKKDSYVIEARNVKPYSLSPSYESYSPSSYYLDMQSDEIEGQMDISDFIDISEQMDTSTSGSNEDLSYLYEAVDDLLQGALYDRDDFDHFYSDLIGMYNVEDNDWTKEFLKNVFEKYMDYTDYVYGGESNQEELE